MRLRASWPNAPSVYGAARAGRGPVRAAGATAAAPATVGRCRSVESSSCRRLRHGGRTAHRGMRRRACPDAADVPARTPRRPASAPRDRCRRRSRYRYGRHRRCSCRHLRRRRCCRSCCLAAWHASSPGCRFARRRPGRRSFGPRRAPRRMRCLRPPSPRYPPSRVPRRPSCRYPLPSRARVTYPLPSSPSRALGAFAYKTIGREESVHPFQVFSSNLRLGSSNLRLGRNRSHAVAPRGIVPAGIPAALAPAPSGLCRPTPGEDPNPWGDSASRPAAVRTRASPAGPPAGPAVDEGRRRRPAP